jgi:SAM-dependent methyltransferase
VSHIYNDTFFDYIEAGARRSARRLIAELAPLLAPRSVLDLGSGRGVWLGAWAEAGATDILGVDGDYVERATLAIPAERFMAADLTRPVRTGRRFDLAQSLEVGEHLPTAASETLVDSLTSASDRVLFSAAVTGQGGEFHVNEQPLSFWQELFAARGYHAYDVLRPRLKDAKEVEPWYRYNSILYVNAAGAETLPEEIRATRIPEGEPVRSGGDLAWRLRRGIVSHLPRQTVTRIAQTRAKILAARAQRRAGCGSPA